MPVTTIGYIAALTACIENLSKNLPATVAEATTDDRIYRLLTKTSGSDAFETFNTIFDRLVKEDSDCRDSEGRFHHIRKGKLGLGKLLSYLKNVDWKDASMSSQYELVKLKLDRLVVELEFLSSQVPPKASKAHGRQKPQKAPKGNQQDAELSDDPKDRNYAPPKGSRLHSEEPFEQYSVGEDGFEIVTEEAAPTKLKRKRIVTTDRSARENPGNHNPTTSSSGNLVDSIEVEEVPEEEDAPKGKKRRGPESKSQEWFAHPVAVTMNGEKRWVFSCKLCATRLSFTRTVAKDKSFDDETKKPLLGNLATHLRTKHPNRDQPPNDLPSQPGEARDISLATLKIMGKFLERGKLNPAVVRSQPGFYKVFSAWLLEDDLAWRTGESGGLARVFEYIEARYSLPTDTTVRNTLARMFSDMYGDIKAEMKRVESKIAFSTDTWTNRAMIFSFAGTIASWISDDWELVERVIDFHPIEDKEHEGEFAALAFAKALSEMGVLDKIGHTLVTPQRNLTFIHIIALTLDNASCNDVLVKTLSYLLLEKFQIQFAPGNAQIRCLTHIVNLVVQKILATLDEAVDPEVLDYYDKAIPCHYSPDSDTILTELENEVDDNDGDDDDKLDEDILDFDQHFVGNLSELSPLQKLRTACVKITSSPQRRSRYRACAQEKLRDERSSDGQSLLANLMVIRDVVTRWNHTHAMIKRALMLRKAIERWIRDYEELWGLSLSTSEWKLLEELCELLEPFTDVTLQMSKSSEPTLPWVLPMFEYMQAHLTSFVSTTKNAHLRRAAQAGLTKLDKYHGPAKISHYNIIATVLHPGLGMEWFEKIGDDRAKAARIVVTHAYSEYHKGNSVPSVANRPVASSSFLSKVKMSAIPRPNSVTVTAGPGPSELDRFFQASNPSVEDALSWWKMNHRQYPTVALMARDFLAIPGASVSVERLFSQGRHLCTEFRSSLKAKTIKQAMLTKAWIKAGLLKL